MSHRQHGRPGRPPVGVGHRPGHQVELDLTDDQADGPACLRCGGRTGELIPVGWVQRPDDVLARLGVTDDARDRAIVAHPECPAR